MPPDPKPEPPTPNNTARLIGGGVAIFGVVSVTSVALIGGINGGGNDNLHLRFCVN